MIYSLLASQTCKRYFSMILLFAVLIALPDPVIHALIPLKVLSLNAQTLLSSFIAEIIGSIGFITLLTKVCNDAHHRTQPSLGKSLTVILIYQLVWIINRLPAVISLFGESVQKTDIAPGTVWFSLASFTLLLFLCRWYFFFIPLLLEDKSLTDSVKNAGTNKVFTRRLALQFVICAIVVSACYEQIINVLFLEQNAEVMAMLPDFGSSIQWCIGSCLAVSAAVHALRLTPIGLFQSSPTPTSILAPFFGARGLGKFIVVLLLCAGIQLYQLTTAVPTVHFKLTQNSYDQTRSLLTVAFDADDAENSFATFQPLLLRIAGEDGFPLSGTTIVTEPSNYPETLLSAPKRLSVTVQFKIINRADDFNQLTDVYLYYGSHKLLRLSPATDSADGENKINGDNNNGVESKDTTPPASLPGNLESYT